MMSCALSLSWQSAHCILYSRRYLPACGPVPRLWVTARPEVRLQKRRMGTTCATRPNLWCRIRRWGEPMVHVGDGVLRLHKEGMRCWAHTNEEQASVSQPPSLPQRQFSCGSHTNSPLERWDMWTPILNAMPPWQPYFSSSSWLSVTSVYKGHFTSGMRQNQCTG